MAPPGSGKIIVFGNLIAFYGALPALLWYAHFIFARAPRPGLCLLSKCAAGWYLVMALGTLGGMSLIHAFPGVPAAASAPASRQTLPVSALGIMAIVLGAFLLGPIAAIFTAMWVTLGRVLRQRA